MHFNETSNERENAAETHINKKIQVITPPFFCPEKVSNDEWSLFMFVSLFFVFFTDFVAKHSPRAIKHFSIKAPILIVNNFLLENENRNKKCDINNIHLVTNCALYDRIVGKEMQKSTKIDDETIFCCVSACVRDAIA